MLLKTLCNHRQKEDARSRGSGYLLEYPLIDALAQHSSVDKKALQNIREKDRAI